MNIEMTLPEIIKELVTVAERDMQPGNRDGGMCDTMAMIIARILPSQFIEPLSEICTVPLANACTTCNGERRRILVLMGLAVEVVYRSESGYYAARPIALSVLRAIARLRGEE